MKINSIVWEDQQLLREIKIQCQQFLDEAGTQALRKYFPADYPDTKRVKMRKKKSTTRFEESFNNAFFTEYPSLRNRSIIINSDNSSNGEEFFVFPSDGYRYVYSPRITNSAREYGTTLADMQKTLGDVPGERMFKDIVDYSYKDTDLQEAIVEKCEIIVYNIPFFYVVRSDVDYTQLLETIK